MLDAIPYLGLIFFVMEVILAGWAIPSYPCIAKLSKARSHYVGLGQSVGHICLYQKQ